MQGRSCEFCEPLYVGDATDNGSCVSCYNECNHRADVCMNVSQLEYGQTRNLSFEPAEVRRTFKQEPMSRSEQLPCARVTAFSRTGLFLEWFWRKI